MSQAPNWSVAELTAYIKDLLESDAALIGVQVSGEVSNLTYHGSGHVYFTLKDAQAQVSCAMFRAQARLAPRLSEGQRIVATGDISVYPPRGSYQLVVQAVRAAGLGDLYQRFLQLKEALEKEGLFDPARKKPLPRFPETIAVVTSPTGAALRDILQTLQRRWNRGRVILVPAVVQGEQGPDSIMQALQQAEASGAELIILARGGGSLEDLWSFNEARVARAIAACALPIITGIGHETDITIADFAADVRASTPTAAAERAVPERAALEASLGEYERQLRNNLQYFINFKRQVLDDYANRLEQAIGQRLRESRQLLDLLQAKLQGLDMRKLLERGYTLTLHQGQLLRSGKALRPGDEIETLFTDARIRSRVEEEEV